MRTNQGDRLTAAKGLILACLISLCIWLLIALVLRGRTPLW